MTTGNNSAAELIRSIERKAPEYLDLLTAEPDEEFERAFDAVLQRAVAQLEANKDNFRTLGEVALTGALAMALSIPGLTLTQEEHSNGHVDVTIVADHCVPLRRKLGEAKIYRGLAYHLDGLDQLLNRYSTGREGRGLLIEYFRTRDIAGLVEQLRKDMDATHPYGQKINTADHVHKWSFLSMHSHSSGEAVEVAHVGCNLYVA